MTTNTQLAQQINNLIQRDVAIRQELAAWIAGAINGGPAGDGRFPLTDYLGTQRLVKSPARLEADVTGTVNSAVVARDAAVAAQTASEDARDAAEAARTECITRATNAASSAAEAASSASQAASASATALAARSGAILASNRIVSPPMCFLHNGSTETAIGFGNFIVALPEQVRVDPGFSVVIETLASGNPGVGHKVVVSEAGWYEISYDVTISCILGTNRLAATVELQKNGANRIPGTLGWTYNRIARTALENGAPATTASCRIITQLLAGDSIRIRTRQALGAADPVALVTQANGCRLLIKRIPDTAT